MSPTTMRSEAAGLIVYAAGVRVTGLSRWYRALPAVLLWMGFPALAQDQAQAQRTYDLVSGLEAETLLRHGEVVEVETIPVGVTQPKRLTLTDGVRTVRAVRKTISEYSQVRDFHDGKPPEIGFRDSFKSEIAAYELDRLVGFDFVPSTVFRRIGRERGSVQLWIEGCMTEAERRERRIRPPDPEAWERQEHNLRLFHQLIYDADYENQQNLLVDENFKIWVVDQSRAFRHHSRLLDRDSLERFSRARLERMRELTLPQLKEALGEWLTSLQLKSLLARRDLILERAADLEKSRGADAVFF